jgi:membrane protein YqaA with SNARE-associated domain
VFAAGGTRAGSSGTRNSRRMTNRTGLHCARKTSPPLRVRRGRICATWWARTSSYVFGSGGNAKHTRRSCQLQPCFRLPVKPGALRKCAHSRYGVVSVVLGWLPLAPALRRPITLASSNI